MTRERRKFREPDRVEVRAVVEDGQFVASIDSPTTQATLRIKGVNKITKQHLQDLQGISAQIYQMTTAQLEAFGRKPKKAKASSRR